MVLMLVEFDLPHSNSEGFVRRSFSFFNYALKGSSLHFLKNMI